MKVNFNIIIISASLFLASCAGPQRLGTAREYLCTHCNCIMQVREDAWDQECAACNCGHVNRACLR